LFSKGGHIEWADLPRGRRLGGLHPDWNRLRCREWKRQARHVGRGLWVEIVEPQRRHFGNAHAARPKLVIEDPAINGDIRDRWEIFDLKALSELVELIEVGPLHRARILQAADSERQGEPLIHEQLRRLGLHAHSDLSANGVVKVLLRAMDDRDAN